MRRPRCEHCIALGGRKGGGYYFHPSSAGLHTTEGGGLIPPESDGLIVYFTGRNEYRYYFARVCVRLATIFRNHTNRSGRCFRLAVRAGYIPKTRADHLLSE